MNSHNGSQTITLSEMSKEAREKLLDEIRPKSEWINHRNDNGHNIADCLICGKATQWHDEDKDGIPRFCWYCGAKMTRT